MSQRELAHRRRRYALLAEIKMRAGCLDCGYREHPSALQFDHVRGEKHFDVSKTPALAWERIVAEIEKCEVRCANCHAVRTYERRRAAAEGSS